MKTLLEFEAHFEKDYSEKIKEYAKEEAFKNNRYIFLEKDTAIFGYCTYCKGEFTMPNIKHRAAYTCPTCGGLHEVRHARYGRKNMQDKKYFTYFEKSKLDASILVARGIWAVIDYSMDDYKQVKIDLYTQAYYVMNHGKGAWRAFHSIALDKKDINGYWSCRVCTSNAVSEVTAPFCNNNEGIVTASLKDAVQATMFQYSDWEGYLATSQAGDDLIGYLSLVAKYPSTEYLYKMGFRQLITRRVRGDKQYHIVNWRGKTLLKVLKLPKHRIKELIKKRVNLDLTLLHIMQENEKQNVSYVLEDAITQAHFFNIHRLLDKEYSQTFLQFMPMSKLYNYIKKQNERNELADLTAYRDYIIECQALNYDLSDDSILFPGDLYTRHERTMTQVQHKKDKFVLEGIKKQAGNLPSYTNEHYLIRPIKNFAELIREGKELVHCVGSYADKYARGDCDLYVVRDLSLPNIPLVTLELRAGSLIQARSYRNSRPDTEISLFIQEFISKLPALKAKLRKEQSESLLTC